MNQISTLDYQQLSTDYQLVEHALHYLADNYQHQPELQEIAASVGYSEFHFQRLFSRWVGISPKRFLQFLTKEHARQLLDGASSVLDASYQSGLSGTGRLHDLFVACEAVTPGEYKNRGEGLTVAYAFHATPFGECLLAVTGRGICGLSFVSSGGRQELLADLRKRWSRADLHLDPFVTEPVLAQIFPSTASPAEQPLRLFLNGTNFQIKVWEALLRIPAGQVVAYEDIATFIGMPTAARAVSRAVAANPIAYIIPCHRVIRKMGVLGGYRWGVERKQAILGWEMAKAV
jgi:AraC family transcriptional regulator, regulatory protein of adaptative response / methylated-DNA-[protein]-cysteine methyltransferase